MDKGRNSRAITSQSDRRNDDFVLDKDIFSNIFDKDIRRVYIYKKAERLAKALHVIAPAFASSLAMRSRLDQSALALVDAALLPPAAAKAALARELLALSSLLAVARTGSLLSVMNADLIAREAQLLLQEVASYEEPRLAFEESPTLAGIAKSAALRPLPVAAAQKSAPVRKPAGSQGHKGHVSDITVAPARSTDRREAILAIIREKGQVYIKDISTIVRGVSEKTVQRELQSLVKEGVLTKQGERRWTLYSLA